MKHNEYQCYICKGVFMKGWSDDEADDEYKLYFPGVSDERVLACEDCYNQVHPNDHPMQVKLANLQNPT